MMRPLRSQAVREPVSGVEATAYIEELRRLGALLPGEPHVGPLDRVAPAYDGPEPAREYLSGDESDRAAGREDDRLWRGLP